MSTTIGNLAESNLSAAFKQKIQCYRGALTSGVKSRPLGTIVITVTGGSAGAGNTIVIKDNISGAATAINAAVAHTGDNTTTAAALALALNTLRRASPTVSNWVATYSGAAVTLIQMRSGTAGTITGVVTGDATVSIANSGNVSNDTATWARFDSGSTFDGDLYYELTFDSTLVPHVLGTATARVMDIDFYCVGQAMAVWFGGIEAVSGDTAYTTGHTIDADTQDPLGPWPWLDCEFPLIVKLAADAVLRAPVRVI